MKRFICWLTIAIVSLAIFPALADNVRQSGLYTYEIKGNGTITITDFDWESNTSDVFIPNMIDGYTVSGIGDEAFKCDEKQKIQYSVIIPESIKSIGKKAFWNSNLSSINIPANVQMIGSGAFFGCSNCQFKIVPNHQYLAVIDHGLYNKANKELISYSWELKEGLSHQSEYVEISIPEGIKTIGAHAFAGLDVGLKKGVNIIAIDMPATVTSIEPYAFSYINASGKGECHVYLPYSVEVIGDYAFYQSQNLAHLSCNTHVKSIGVSAFEKTHGRQINLSFSHLETIGERAFYNCHLYPVKSSSEGVLPVIDFTGSSLYSIPDNAISYSSGNDNMNNFLIPTTQIRSIGKNNPSLGLLINDESDFSSSLTVLPSGLNPQVNSLPRTISAIESEAFTEIKNSFALSSSLDDIATNAFPEGSTFVVEAGSYAELWCSENGFGYTLEGQDNLDWLNN